MTTPTKNSCSACGTSPVNHHFLFVLSVMEETLGRATDKIFFFAHTKRWQDISIFVEKTLYIIFGFFGVVSYNQDIELALTGRSKLIWQEARKRGIYMEQVRIFGKLIEFYRARIPENDNKFFYFQSLPIPPSIPQSGYKWLDDKFVLFEELSKNGVPIPKAKKVFTYSAALKAFETLKKPVIIKPNYGSRGRHTTTNINTEKELHQAFETAKQITWSMVIQEHLSGSVYRATVINDELVAFFRADAPQVVGDGVNTIHALIDAKNTDHHERLSDISINEDLLHFISREGYNLESIPVAGVTVNLSAKTGRMYGGYTREMLPEVHPRMHSIFKKAGSLMHAPVLGFDLIIGDPTQNPDEQRWGIIECNSLPYIDLHYLALEGKPKNLAENVWDLWKTHHKPAHKQK